MSKTLTIPETDGLLGLLRYIDKEITSRPALRQIVQDKICLLESIPTDRNNRVLIVEIAKLWGGHEGQIVNSTNEELLLIIRDSVSEDQVTKRLLRDEIDSGACDFGPRMGA